MIGLEFIAKTFQVEYKSIAEKIGVSPATIQDWLKERRKIPPKRVEQLSELFGVEAKYFGKELTPSEKLSIQIFKLEQDDISHEVPVFDDHGNEVGTTTFYENESAIRHLTEESQRLEKIERLNGHINDLVANESVNDEFEADVRKYTDNLETFFSVVRTLKSGNKEQIQALKLLLNFLDLDNINDPRIDEELAMVFYGSRYIERFIPRGKKKFAKELLSFLLEYEVITAERLKKYCDEK